MQERLISVHALGFFNIILASLTMYHTFAAGSWSMLVGLGWVGLKGVVRAMAHMRV